MPKLGSVWLAGAACALSGPSVAETGSWSLALELGSPVMRLVGELGPGERIEITCGAGGVPEFIIHRAAGADLRRIPQPVNLSISISGGSGTWVSPGSFNVDASGNETIYFGDATAVADMVVGLAGAFGDVGIDLASAATGEYVRWVVPAPVVTSAATDLAAACGYSLAATADTAVPSRVPPVDSSAAELVWLFDEVPDGQGGRHKSISLRNVENDGSFRLTCQADGSVSLTYVTEVMRSLQMDGTTVAAAVQLGDTRHAVQLGLVTQLDDFGVLISHESPRIAGIAQSLAAGPASVAMLIAVPATGELHQRNFVTTNLAAAAGQFVARCFGREVAR